jgi:hypothetical protein
MPAPSPHAVMHAVSTLQQVRERLLALDPTIADDEQLFADMLDGEGGSAVQILERLVEASIEADSLAEGAKLRRADMNARVNRLERRRDALRAVALDALTALTLRRLERPTWTASLYHIPAPLLIDEDALPDQWWRTKREPKRAEIHAELNAGGEIPGAQLGNGRVGISVKTK